MIHSRLYKFISVLLMLGLILPLFNCAIVSADNLAADNSAQDTGIEAAASDYSVSEVPCVYIDTEEGNGNELLKCTGYVGASVTIVDTDGSVIEDSGSQVKVRGNSTSSGAKKPFNIKLSSKTDVLGMGSAKKWCLLANCFDPSLMRNYVGLYLAKQLGINYTTEQRIVELWMDGVYKGAYLLTEAVEVGKTRVNIDIDAGDFLFENNLSRVEDDVTYVISENGVRFEIDEPEEPTEEQLEAIQEVIDRFTEAMDSGDFYRIVELADVDSFARMYLLNEYMKTVDCPNFSIYCYYKDGLIYCGPAWDYDLSSGNASTSYSYYDEYFAGDDDGYTGLWASDNPWFAKLLKYSEFKNFVYNIFAENAELFESIFSDGGVIDSVIGSCSGAFERNYSDAGWDVSFPYSKYGRTPFDTFEENVDFLKEWLEQRYLWLRDTWNIDDSLTDLRSFYMAQAQEALEQNKNSRTDDPLIIISQPETNIKGDLWTKTQVTFEVQGTDVTYQWYYKDLSGMDAGKVTFAGARTDTLTIPINKDAATKFFYCVAIDANGSRVVSDKVYVNYNDETAYVHNFDYSTEVIKEATCTEDGAVNHICSCGATQMETIAPLGHSFTEYVSDGNATYEADGTKTAVCEKCGAKDTVVDEGSKLRTEGPTLIPIDGVYYYFDGDYVPDKFGFADYDGSKFLIVQGKVSANVNGLINNPDDVSEWYYVAGGQVQTQYTGLALYDGAWFYVTNGRLDTTFSGLVNYDGGRFIVAAGQIQTGVNGLWHNAESLGGDDKWYYFANGQAQIQYTGLTYYDGAWFYVENGALAEDHIN